MIMNHNSVKVIHVLDTECFLSTCNHHFCIVIFTFVQLLKLNVHGEICGTAGGNRPTGANFPMEIFDL